MKKVYNTTTQEVMPYPRLDDQPIAGLTSDLVVLEVTTAEQPEYNQETETLSAIQVVDLENGEYRTEWEITPKPVVPNWQGFMDRLDRPTAKPGGTGLFDELMGINPVLALHSLQSCREFNFGFGGEDELRTLTWFYQGLVPGMTTTQINTLNQAIADFNIPIEI